MLKRVVPKTVKRGFSGATANSWTELVLILIRSSVGRASSTGAVLMLVRTGVDSRTKLEASNAAVATVLREGIPEETVVAFAVPPSIVSDGLVYKPPRVK